MSRAEKISFLSLCDRREEYDRRCRDSGDHKGVSPSWADGRGGEVTSDSSGSEVSISSDGKDAYFYLTSERGGTTLYHVDMGSFALSLASRIGQILVPGDPELICDALAKGKTKVQFVRDSGTKGKGASYAAVVLYTRNRSRSDSLVDYRIKMRARQLPLKKEKQWQFFAELIEKELITSEALEQVAFLARDIEAARQGTTAALPDGWTVEKAKREFILTAVEG